MTDLRDDTRAGFGAAYGYAPSALWSAPGRLSLLGEHTEQSGGSVLAFAIDRRTVLAASPRQDNRIRVATSLADDVAEIALGELDADRLAGWAAYPLGTAWAFGRFGVDLSTATGADLYLDSTVPVGAGLASSAALECAVALALNDLWSLGLDRMELAHRARLAEDTIVGASSGIMDQSASLFGESDRAVYLDGRNGDIQIIDLGLEGAGLRVLVIDTGVGPFDAARDADDETDSRHLRHVVTENERVHGAVRALRDEGPSALGRFLDASHRSIRDDLDIRTPELDLAVETALASGAIGARMTARGGGGTAIALVAADELSLLQVAIDGAFAEHGYGQPDTFIVGASSGATRE